MTAVVERSVLPKFRCPFPSPINPHAATTFRHTQDWLQLYALSSSAGAARHTIADVAWLAARLHPNAAPDMLQLVADWYAWLFCQDDHYDTFALRNDPQRLTVLNQRYLAILRGASATKQGACLGYALQDLRQRFVRTASGPWMNRFLQQVDDYFRALVWEATNRKHEIVPSVTTYMRMRPTTAGLGIEHSLSELVEQCTLPPHLHCHMLVQQISLAADYAICWLNDLVSLNKEIRHGDVHNLVLVLQHEHQIDLQAATQHVAALHNAAVRSFNELSAQLARLERLDSTIVQRYTNVLQARINGHRDWVHTAQRYHQSTQR